MFLWPDLRWPNEFSFLKWKLRDGPVSARTLLDFYPAISVGKVKDFFYMQGQTDISGKSPNNSAAIYGNTYEHCPRWPVRPEAY